MKRTAPRPKVKPKPTRPVSKTPADATVKRTTVTKAANKPENKPHLSWHDRRDMKARAKYDPSTYNERTAQRAKTTRAGMYTGSVTHAVASANQTAQAQSADNVQINRYRDDAMVKAAEAAANTKSDKTITIVSEGGLVKATDPTEGHDETNGSGNGLVQAESNEYNDEYYRRLEKL